MLTLIIFSALPPEYQVQDSSDSYITPRCSRHTAAAGSARINTDNYNSDSHHLIKTPDSGLRNNKEELAMVNMNHYPSSGELRYYMCRSIILDQTVKKTRPID